ncbi:hypothetical protein TSAR_005608 [Trichomalopsis sarcophagae]|uniref:MIF4G domain-containing protein n=1 Tax=Trichomalopsis sarcophagae TaxID=543379 RepID=A0A232ETA7_9HYME|nr:hypothetical protein TSAR_005608 [Trichomalopsis sarcophagae]
MDHKIPNFKIGEVVLNADKNNDSLDHFYDSDISFVVLAKDISRGSLQNLTPNNEQVLQLSLDKQTVPLRVSHMRRIESRLLQMEEENAKLKKMLEESDAVKKQQFQEVEAWQREVMSICQDHNQKFLQIKKLVDRIKVENDYLRNCCKLQSLAASTALSASTADKEPLVQKSTKTTETPVVETQNINAETEIGSTMIAGTNKRLIKFLENMRKFQEKLKEVTERHKDDMLAVPIESDASHVEKRNSAQEGVMLNELKRLLDDERKLHKEQGEPVAEENIFLRSKCDTLEMDLKYCNTKLINSQRFITELRKQITELQNADETSVECGSQRIPTQRYVAIKKQLAIQMYRNQKNLYKEPSQKKIHDILNKFPAQGIRTFINQLYKLEIDSLERLQGVIDLVFEKIIDNPNYAFVCVIMCKELSNTEVASATNNCSSTNLFRFFLTRCQTEFEENFTVKEDTYNKKLREIDECADLVKKIELLINFEEDLRRKRLKSLGIILLIGHSFNLNMLPCQIMYECIRHLSTEVNDIKLECLCILMLIIGERLNTKINTFDHFKLIKQIAKQKDNIKRETQSLVEDIIKLKNNKWIGRNAYLRLWMTFNTL